VLDSIRPTVSNDFCTVNGSRRDFGELNRLLLRRLLQDRPDRDQGELR